MWDYPRPPRVARVRRRIRVEFAGVVIADTERAYRVIETASPPTYYLPPADIRMECLEPSAHRSVWNGRDKHGIGCGASVTALSSMPRGVTPIPWLAGFEAIRDHVAFYAGKMDTCYVGDQRVTPQAGGFSYAT